MGMRTTPVTDKTAWTANSLAEDSGWIRHFTSDELQELDAALQRARHIPITEITKADFPLEHLVPSLQAASDEIHHGHGLVVLRGLPVETYSKEDASRIYWGVGLYLGTPVTQN
jgi:hypothetical protein